MLRRNLSLFLILIISLPTLYKAGFFTYFQLNRDFIAENYCINRDKPITLCYGQCFLNKGLMLISETQNTAKIVSGVKAETPQLFCEISFAIQLPLVCTLSQPFLPTTTPLANGASSSLLRPPSLG